MTQYDASGNKIRPVRTEKASSFGQLAGIILLALVMATASGMLSWLLGMTITIR